MRKSQGGAEAGDTEATEQSRLGPCSDLLTGFSCPKLSRPQFRSSIKSFLTLFEDAPASPNIRHCPDVISYVSHRTVTVSSRSPPVLDWSGLWASLSLCLLVCPACLMSILPWHVSLRCNAVFMRPSHGQGTQGGPTYL